MNKGILIFSSDINIMSKQIIESHYIHVKSIPNMITCDDEYQCTTFFDTHLKCPFIPDAVIVRQAHSKISNLSCNTEIHYLTCPELIGNDIPLVIFRVSTSSLPNLEFDLDGSSVHQSYRFHVNQGAGEASLCDFEIHLLLQFVKYSS